MLQAGRNRLLEGKPPQDAYDTDYFAVFRSHEGRKVLNEILDMCGVFSNKQSNETSGEFLARRRVGIETVSYTHLKLPTIYSV